MTCSSRHDWFDCGSRWYSVPAMADLAMATEDGSFTWHLLEYKATTTMALVLPFCVSYCKTVTLQNTVWQSQRVDTKRLDLVNKNEGCLQVYCSSSWCVTSARDRMQMIMCQILLLRNKTIANHSITHPFSLRLCLRACAVLELWYLINNIECNACILVTLHEWSLPL